MLAGFWVYQSKKGGKDHESIQSNTTPDPGRTTHGKGTKTQLNITNRSQPLFCYCDVGWDHIYVEALSR